MTFNGGLATAGNASNPSSTNVGGTVRTSGDQIDLGTVTLTAATVLDSGGGNINIASFVGGAQDLTLVAGIGAGTGNITFQGVVGGTVGIGTLTITNATDVTALAGITAKSINVHSSGTTTFNGPLDSDSPATIILVGEDFTLLGPVTTSNGGMVHITNTGDLIIGPAANMNLTGPFIQDGTGPVILGASIITDGDLVSFKSQVTVTDNIAIRTAGGSITFEQLLNGQSGEQLEINAGGGLLIITSTGRELSLTATNTIIVCGGKQCAAAFLSLVTDVSSQIQGIGSSSERTPTRAALIRDPRTGQYMFDVFDVPFYLVETEDMPGIFFDPWWTPTQVTRKRAELQPR